MTSKKIAIEKGTRQSGKRPADRKATRLRHQKDVRGTRYHCEGRPLHIHTEGKALPSSSPSALKAHQGERPRGPRGRGPYHRDGYFPLLKSGKALCLYPTGKPLLEKKKNFFFKQKRSKSNMGRPEDMFRSSPKEAKRNKKKKKLAQPSKNWDSGFVESRREDKQDGRRLNVSSANI